MEMVRQRNRIGLALLSGGLLLAGMPASPAATSSTPDILSNDRAQDADSVDLGSVKPIARPARDAAKPAPSGNPLWSIPLSVLSATQERPIFSASRRQPPRAVIALPVEQVNAPPPKAAEPERPPLALIGAVVGDSEAIAVFVDRTNQKMVRLRQGETHAGWLLSSVRSCGAKSPSQRPTGPRSSLKSSDAPAAGAPILPMPTAIGAGPPNHSYAPFVPRSTPKNGEHDGL
jgi:general secretion pathway protein N